MGWVSFLNVPFFNPTKVNKRFERIKGSRGRREKEGRKGTRQRTRKKKSKRKRPLREAK